MALIGQKQTSAPSALNSMLALHPTATALLKQVVEWLVAGDFNAVAAATNAYRLSAEQMAHAIRIYGQTLMTPPSSSYESLDIVRVTRASEPTWSVRFDLWTLEEGRSDLTLECTISMPSTGSAAIEIDGIHVL
jgi:hypothetical protein